MSAAYDFWQTADSEEAKAHILGKKWGETVNTYLWYEIGENEKLSDEDLERIVQAMFLSSPQMGDIEVHKSNAIKGAHLLRLHGRLRLQPAVVLGGRYCPLYQYGHGGGPGQNASADFVNFYLRLGPQLYRCYR